MLGDYRSVSHWENMAVLKQDFPSISFSSDLFVIDRDRMTGASTSLNWRVRCRTVAIPHASLAKFLDLIGHTPHTPASVDA